MALNRLTTLVSKKGTLDVIDYIMYPFQGKKRLILVGKYYPSNLIYRGSEITTTAYVNHDLVEDLLKIIKPASLDNKTIRLRVDLESLRANTTGYGDEMTAFISAVNLESVTLY